MSAHKIIRKIVHQKYKETNHYLAEDLIQDAWIYWFKTKDKEHPNKLSLENWACAVALFFIKRAIEKRYKEGIRVTKRCNFNSLPYNLEDRMEAKEILENIMTNVKKWPIMLSYAEGRTFEEVSEIFGRKNKSWSCRIVDNIRQKVEELDLT